MTKVKITALVAAAAPITAYMLFASAAQADGDTPGAK
jgi:hypothetical protein